ncbi:hypothetical protein ANOM_002314 [Aspergillus nomiae NRRL 13137]|uniref:Cyanovirin-N domain-containing protein n=1 Tax=Aspergillus nomiae NRRL (strain ATCC 15546 / NRRL 13137 / CBS 260.88 / M93) TaxID=1509407 RepID=A0A0L1JD95_ASPN3|nr:uncharacterized protein ANOM_002314 [Aspergillus nomiae NRRL 13137]KNG89682.1 hypothetical protein ANOM_002314 [Aspergillus nomiae NRRL 13137]
MSFHKSCKDIRLEPYEGQAMLSAVVETDDEDASAGDRWVLFLDEQIGNHNGQFCFPGKNFTQTAKNVSLEFRDGVPWLTAGWLQDQYGNWATPRSFNLAEHVKNDRGALAWAVS